MTTEPPPRSPSPSNSSRKRPRLAAGTMVSVMLGESPLSMSIHVNAERPQHFLPSVIHALEEALEQLHLRIEGVHETSSKGGPLRRAEAAKLAGRPEVFAAAAELRAAVAALAALPRPAELMPKTKKR